MMECRLGKRLFKLQPVEASKPSILSGTGLCILAQRRDSLTPTSRRDNIDSLKTHLTNLGANQVLTYDALNDPTAFKSLRTEIQQLINGRPIRLFLNCVSGPTTTSLSRLLGKDAHLVSYGAMSKEPLSLPTSLFIFKNLTCHGFWQSRWYEDASEEKKRGLVEKLVGLKVSLLVLCSMSKQERFQC